MRNIDRFLLSQLDKIPFIKEGKSDIDTLSSYCYDIRNFKVFEFKLRQSQQFGKSAQKQVLKKWNDFLEMRGRVDFEPYQKHHEKMKYDFDFDI